MSELQRSTFFVQNGDGWLLHLRRTVAPARRKRGLRPLVIVPGYAMNSFIFGFHPRGTSMERHFAQRGFEVWSIDLRGQGRSRPNGNERTEPSIRACSEVDLPCAIEAILAQSESGAERVDVIGCSLGGTYVYAHMALCPEHRIGSVVAIGAPLRWESVHPLMKLVFASPRFASMLRFKGTQRLAEIAFPVLARVPGVLSLYMNTAHVDLTQARDLTRTVEDPHPRINKEIARWIHAKDLVLGGVRVTEALGGEAGPLLIVLANRDGIVPPDSALSAKAAWGGEDVDLLRVGSEEDWYAHACLFIADEAPQRVFEPIARWLLARGPATPKT